MTDIYLEEELIHFLGKFTYVSSTMGNNRLHALMLVLFHNNILDKVNLAVVVNHFVNIKDRRKQTFRYFSQGY